MTHRSTNILTLLILIGLVAGALVGEYGLHAVGAVVDGDHWLKAAGDLVLIPPAKTLKITNDRSFCGDVPDETYVIGANKGVKNVVVAITNVEKGRLPTKRCTQWSTMSSVALRLASRP